MDETWLTLDKMCIAEWNGEELLTPQNYINHHRLYRVWKIDCSHVRPESAGNCNSEVGWGLSSRGGKILGYFIIGAHCG